MGYQQGPGITNDIASGGQYDNVDTADSLQYSRSTAEDAARAELAANRSDASVTNAAESAAEALASRDAAAGSATAADAAATSAINSASAASNSASAALVSANNAGTSATNAANSAASALSSASSATSSASAASTSAANALASANTAAVSETNAVNAYDQFDDRWLGPKAADPLTNNDGDPLQIGTIYFNTTDSIIRVYTAAGWRDGYAVNTDIQVNSLQVLGGTANEGILTWDNVDKTLKLALEDGTVSLQLGQEAYIRVANSTGVTLPNGSIVYQNNGVNANDHITVDKFIADGSINPSLVLGMLTTDILPGEEGFTTILGKVRGINTSAYTVGSIIYASPTVAGGITNVPPTSPQKTVVLGSVIKSDIVSGEYMINMRISPDASVVTYDGSSSSLLSSNVKSALDELDLKKINVSDLTSNINLYPTSVASVTVPTYRRAVTSVSDPSYDVATFNLSSGSISTPNQLVEEFISAAGLINGNPGTLTVPFSVSIGKSAGGAGANVEFLFRIYKRDSGGTETLMGTSGTTGSIADTIGAFNNYTMSASVVFSSFVSTDRVVIKLYGNHISGSAGTYDIQLGGNNPARVALPVPISVIPIPAALGIQVDTTAFNNILSGADGNVQAALNTLDDHTHTYSSITGKPQLVEKSSTTGSAYMPAGTTAQRDGSPSAGYLRFNSTLASFEGYDGVTWGPVAAAPVTGLRNKLINGKMEIAQRGSSFTGVASSVYTLDRWQWLYVGSGIINITRDGSVPTGDEFQNSLGITVSTSDASIAAGDLYVIRQPIEGYNVRDLIGRTFTLSFWVKSAKTGAHCVAFGNDSGNRSYVATYTVNAVNTWEQKTVTVTDGLITAGTWDWTTGRGLIVAWVLAAGTTFQTTAGAWQTGNFFATSGQVNVMDTTSNVFALTGVQLEVGSFATPFEHRPYGLELALCQRYYQIAPSFRYIGYQVAGNGATHTLSLLCEMRAVPTVTVQPTFSLTNLNAASMVPISSSSVRVTATATGTGAYDVDMTVPGQLASEL